MNQMMNKVLIAITTFNQLKNLKQCVDYINYYPGDIVVIDDCSTDKTREWLLDQPFDSYHTNPGKGLTHSWNIAYKIFKDSKYTHMVLINSDVFIPAGSIENMLSVHSLVVPMANYNGTPFTCKRQAVDYWKDVRSFEPEKLADMQSVQDLCARNFIDINCYADFCMCFSRGIIRHGRGGILFGNDLSMRAKIALGSFVYKGKSYEKDSN